MIGEQASKQYRRLEKAVGVTVPRYLIRSQLAKQRLEKLAKK